MQRDRIQLEPQDWAAPGCRRESARAAARSPFDSPRAGFFRRSGRDSSPSLARLSLPAGYFPSRLLVNRPAKPLRTPVHMLKSCGFFIACVAPAAAEIVGQC